MAAALKRYAVEDLTVGMFVSALDRPMASTPFPLEGFYIRKKEELQEIAKYCNYVMVNITKSRAVQTLSCTLQLEVADIPKALTNPVGYKIERATRPPRVVKPRQKGRVKRLAFLLLVSGAIWYYHDVLRMVFHGLL